MNFPMEVSLQCMSILSPRCTYFCLLKSHSQAHISSPLLCLSSVSHARCEPSFLEAVEFSVNCWCDLAFCFAFYISVLVFIFPAKLKVVRIQGPYFKTNFVSFSALPYTITDAKKYFLFEEKINERSIIFI